MALIVWQEAYDTGIAGIDAQHREMADLVNALEAAAGESAEAIAATLDQLLVLTRIHFAEEARQFRQTGYPDAARHELRHRHLMLILQRFSDYSGHSREDFDDQLEFLRSWLVDHIRRDDRAFADYALARPVRKAAQA